eukprot:COSAG02_NODE_12534_length_1529_cov_14.772113_1_plen_136_part_10
MRNYSPGAARVLYMFVTELCVLRTFGGVDFSLIFICAQSVPEFFGTYCAQVFNFPSCPNVRNTHGSVGSMVLLDPYMYIPPPREPCALHMVRHQCNSLSAPQSVSSNFLETDWAAIFQWKVITRSMCNAHGSEGTV